MQLQYGSRSRRPAPRRRAMIQERTYATPADMRRALTLYARHWRKQGVHYNCFAWHSDAAGRPVAYMARLWSDAELRAAGFDPDTFYADVRSRERARHA